MTVVDARPEQSKKTSALLSYVISDCLYGVARFGDEIVPDRLARLQRDILAAFGDEVRGKQLNVLRYELHYGATPPNPCPIVIPACQAGGKPPVDGPIYIEPKCSRQKMRVGWFDKADLERNTLPIIADVQVEFEGQTYSANAAYAPAGPLDGDADGPKFQAPGQIVVRKVNQRLIEAMRASSP